MVGERGQQAAKFQQGTVEAVDQHDGRRALPLAYIGAGDGGGIQGGGDRSPLHLGHHGLGRGLAEISRQGLHRWRQTRSGRDRLDHAVNPVAVGAVY
jgi:hypothetical protein